HIFSALSPAIAPVLADGDNNRLFHGQKRPERRIVAIVECRAGLARRCRQAARRMRRLPLPAPAGYGRTS
ncbi:hypothetical protein AAIH51_35320, partial [Pseudomonas aeruginosa]